MIIYIAVTDDEKELPIEVCDSTDELEDILGLERGTVLDYIKNGRNDPIEEMRFYKVEIDEE